MRRESNTPFAKAVHKLDRSVSIMIRTDPTFSKNGSCVTCKRHNLTVFDAGHFRRRECMSTRFDYRNLGKQCRICNHFESGRSYEFSLWIDRTWGRGTAKKLLRKSAEIKKWDARELEQLAGAAKIGFLAYKQLYDELALTDSKKTAN